VTAEIETGKAQHESALTTKLYEDEQIGNEDLLKSLQFGFRDADDGMQYHTTTLQWPEMRWQQLARLKIGTGGKAWDEKAVLYQGQRTFPWPGRQKWEEESAMLLLAELKMFDADKGVSKDRPTPYEDPQIGDWQSGIMADDFTLIR
jgi:hypothetical protein